METGSEGEFTDLHKNFCERLAAFEEIMQLLESHGLQPTDMSKKGLMVGYKLPDLIVSNKKIGKETISMLLILRDWEEAVPCIDVEMVFTRSPKIKHCVSLGYYSDWSIFVEEDWDDMLSEGIKCHYAGLLKTILDRYKEIDPLTYEQAIEVIRKMLEFYNKIKNTMDNAGLIENEMTINPDHEKLKGCLKAFEESVKLLTSHGVTRYKDYYPGFLAEYHLPYIDLGLVEKKNNPEEYLEFIHVLEWMNNESKSTLRIRTEIHFFDDHRMQKCYFRVTYEDNEWWLYTRYEKKDMETPFLDQIYFSLLEKLSIILDKNGHFCSKLSHRQALDVLQKIVKFYLETGKVQQN